MATGQCSCACSDNYMTGTGQYNGNADLPCTLAPAYVLAGATNSAYNGRYERLPKHKCEGAHVYQLGGEGGSVLYRYRRYRFYMPIELLG